MGSLSHRFSGHKANAKHRPKNNILYQAMNKYGVENFHIKAIIECDNKDLDRLERFYIKYYNSLSPNGYNIQIGGKDITNSKPCYKIDPHNLKIVKIYNSGIEAVLEHNTAVYDLLNERGQCRIADNFFFIYKDKYESLKNPRQYILNKIQPICQLDLQGKIIQFYTSLQDAENYTGIFLTNIRSCCQDKNALAGNYQ